jgi:hypothetical protein
VAVPDDHNARNTPTWDFLARVAVNGIAIRYARSGDAIVRLVIPKEHKEALVAITNDAGINLRATFERPARGPSGVHYIPPHPGEDPDNEWGHDFVPQVDPPARPVPSLIPTGPVLPEDVLPRLLGHIVAEAEWTLAHGDTNARNALTKTVLTLASRAQTGQTDAAMEQLREEHEELRQALRASLLRTITPTLPIEATAIEDMPGPNPA